MKAAFPLCSLAVSAVALALGLFPAFGSAAQILHRQLQAAPETLDPAKSQSDYEAIVESDLFEGLVDIHDGAIIPGVAESWERAPDGVTYTFHLRKDARWSNGEPVTAADFVYAWRRVADPKTASTGFDAIAALRHAREIGEGKITDLAQLGLEALDEHTLRVVTALPSPEFLMDCAASVAYPTPRTAIERWGQDWTRPDHFVGNGAVILKSAEPDGNIVLARSPNYWQANTVKLDEVDYVLSEQDAVAVKMFRSGELDAAQPPTNEVPGLRAMHDPALQTTNGGVLVYLFFNMKTRALAGDRRLREALALAYDPVMDAEKLRPLGQKPAYSWVAPAVPDYTQQQPATAYLSAAERLARARRLYAEAGYGPDHPLRVTIHYATSDDTKTFMPALAQMWKQALGVETALENEEFRFFLQRVRRGDFQIGLIGNQGQLSPRGYLSLWETGNILGSAGYSNPELAGLLKTASTTMDAAERRALYEHAERVIVADVPGIPLEFTPINTLVSPRLKGWSNDRWSGTASRFLKFQE